MVNLPGQKIIDALSAKISFKIWRFVSFQAPCSSLSFDPRRLAVESRNRRKCAIQCELLSCVYTFRWNFELCRHYSFQYYVKHTLFTFEGGKMRTRIQLYITSKTQLSLSKTYKLNSPSHSGISKIVKTFRYQERNMKSLTVLFLVSLFFIGSK